MESPGAYLKREREARGISLEDISRPTKIRVGLLAAIERDDFDALPAVPFVKGFIQAYCKYLGLDVQDALLRYEAYLRTIAENEAAALAQKSEVIIPDSKTSPLHPPLTMLALAAIAVLILISGIYILSKKQPSPVPDSSHSQAQVENKGETTKQEMSPPVRSEEVRSEEIKPLPSVNIADRGELTLVVEAIQPAWIRTQIDDRNPFEVSLKEGEKVKWHAKQRFSLLIGNAGGVNVIFNGNPMGKLGDDGKVVKLVLPPADKKVGSMQ